MLEAARSASWWIARLLAIVAVLLAATVAPATRPPLAAAPARQGIGQLHLALGDSLSVGLLASLPDTRGYVPQFNRLLERAAGRPVALRNVSVNGETSTSLLSGSQLTAAHTAIAEARARGWRVSPLTISIGGNDVLDVQADKDAVREVALTRYRANLAQLFDGLIAATSRDGVRESDLLTMSIYNPFGGDPNLQGSDAWWVERFNAVLADEATRRDIAVARAYERFRGQEQRLTFMPLDFHPNNRGHLALAEELWRASGYDSTAPTLEIVAPVATTTGHAAPTIRVRAGDTVGVASVEARLDGALLPTPIFQPSLDLYVTYWDARAAPAGEHRLTITVTDLAGNTTRREQQLQR